MFDNLSDKLQRVFKNLRGEGKLSAENMEAALREIRVALLEADVHFRVAKQFIEAVREKAMGQDVLTALSPTQQAQLMAARQSAATLTTVSSQALSTTSARFASIQQLIGAIPSASDQKGILDLQARIQAEQGMLQNESTKLNTMYQLSQAQELTRQQRLREQAIADVGSLRDLPPLKLP